MCTPVTSHDNPQQLCKLYTLMPPHMHIPLCTKYQGLLQVAESALADKEVRGGDRLALMRRALRLGKPPRRWKQPAWVCQLPCEPPEVECLQTLHHWQ